MDFFEARGTAPGQTLKDIRQAIWVMAGVLLSGPASHTLILSFRHRTGRDEWKMMRQAREFSRVQGWNRVIPFQLAPLFLLLTCFFLGCVSTPAVAAPFAIMLDQTEGTDGGEGSSKITLSSGDPSESEDRDPYSLGLREVYLNHLRFSGAAGVSGPQIRYFGDLLFFEARGPPGAKF